MKKQNFPIKTTLFYEIDISGSDILEPNYVIVVAEKGNKKRVLGWKFSEKIVRILRSRHGQGLYRYGQSKNQKVAFKIRLYCATIFYIFKELNRRQKILGARLEICRDFPGKEADIKNQLNYLLGKKLGINLEFNFLKLPKGSLADTYAYLLRRDYENKFSKQLIQIKLDEFEVFLK